MTDGLRDDCQVCGFHRIPGLTHCVNCGEPLESAFHVVVTGHTLGPLPPRDDLLTYPGMRVTPAQHADWIEARALEYAGDIKGATEIYERLVKERCRIVEAHKRLAILYRKASQRTDEERVVRAAIALIGGGGAGSWFVLRLAKILAGKTSPPTRSSGS